MVHQADRVLHPAAEEQPDHLEEEAAENDEWPKSFAKLAPLVVQETAAAITVGHRHPSTAALRVGFRWAKSHPSWKICKLRRTRPCPELMTLRLKSWCPTAGTMLEDHHHHQLAAVIPVVTFLC